MKRSHVALIVAGTCLVVAAGVFLVSGRGGSAAPGVAQRPRTSDDGPAVTTLPTTNSTNAADSYREAMRLMADMRADSRNIEQLDRYSRGELDAQAGEFFQRHAAILGWIRRGASCPSCDWGDQGTPQQQIEALDLKRSLVSFAAGHGKYALQQKRPEQALDDALATLALARQIGMEATLTSMLVQVAAETIAIDLSASCLASLPASRLKSLPAELDALPKPVPGAQMILAEKRFAQQNAQAQGFMAQSMLRGLEPLYAAAAGAMDKTPAEFAKAVDEQLAQNPNNMMMKGLVPSLKRSQQTLCAGSVKRAMLRAAIDVVANGPGAIQNHPDPYGSGPFHYTKTPGGFELSSELRVSDAAPPVHLFVPQP